MLTNETVCHAVSEKHMCDKPMHACKLTTLKSVGLRIVVIDFTRPRYGYRYGINVCAVAVTGQEQLRRLGKNTKTRETRTVGESKIKFVTKV